MTPVDLEKMPVWLKWQKPTGWGSCWEPECFASGNIQAVVSVLVFGHLKRENN